MDERRRGAWLTTFAILFAIVAVEDLLKPFKLEGPQTGLVFFGARQSGLANAILGPALGLVLLAYAAGIWRMRRYALTLGWIYFAYVLVNLALFSARNPPPKTTGEFVFGIVYIAGAITITLATALALTRRQPDLA